MNSQTVITNENSVLTFYTLGDINVAGLNYVEIWDNFVANKTDNVVCKNVFKSNISSEALAETLRDKNNIRQDLAKHIDDEYQNVADYVFVQPVVGKPIFGIQISKLIRAG